MSQVLIVQTTCDQREVVEKIARNLLEKRLVACCQISSPVSSMYRWQEKLETSDEYVCTIKTTETRRQQVIETIAEHHSYELPEIIWWECQASDSYAAWLSSETT